MKSLGVCQWYVRMPWCRCVEHGLDYITFYVERHIAALVCSGAGPTNDISIEFEIRPKFAVLWFKICSTNHNEILHMS